MGKRLKDFIPRLRELGCTVEPPTRGSHWKVSKPGMRPYMLPAHNGDRTELTDNYINALCRNLQLDKETLLGGGKKKKQEPATAPALPPAPASSPLSGSAPAPESEE